MILNFHPNGTADCLYSDLIPLTDLGQLSVRRASWIEFNAATQQWEVRFDGPRDQDSEPLFSNPSREACLAWEHEQLDQ